MNCLAVMILALAISLPTINAVGAQSEGTPLRNALVVVTGRDDVLHGLIQGGGTPSSVTKMLAEARDLLQISAHYASTNSSGGFDVKAPLRPGMYNVSVFAPGYVMNDRDVVLSVDGIGTPQNTTLFLQPSAVVSGTVTDRDGRPLAGIIVAADGRESSNYDVTTSDGVYVIDTGLATGEHRLYAFAPAFTDFSGLVGYSGPALPTEGRVPSFLAADKSGFISAELPVQLEQGKLSIHNFQLEQSAKISGTVTDSNGNPIAGVAVLAFGESGDAVSAIDISNETGHYSLDNGLAPGRYDVIVPSLFSRGFSPFSANITAPHDGQVNIKLYNSSTITGRVVDALGNPVAGAKVRLVEKQISQVSSVKGFLAAGMAEATSDPDGKFKVDRGVGNGTFVATASFGDVPVESSVELQSGSSGEIKLGFSEIISIAGTIRDPSGMPIENASIAPGFAHIIGNDAIIAKSDEDGRFLLTAPIGRDDEKSLYGEVVVAAPGYATQTAEAASEMNITLQRAPLASISGIVLAQGPAPNHVELALERQATLKFGYEETSFNVGLRTNSRIVNASFDHGSKSITLDFEGIQGAGGSTELTIPKALLGGPFAVELNEMPYNDYSLSQNATHSKISVSKNDGLGRLVVQGATVVPEFPFPVLAAVSIAISVGIWRKLRIS